MMTVEHEMRRWMQVDFCCFHYQEDWEQQENESGIDEESVRQDPLPLPGMERHWLCER